MWIPRKEPENEARMLTSRATLHSLHADGQGYTTAAVAAMFILNSPHAITLIGDR